MTRRQIVTHLERRHHRSPERGTYLRIPMLAALHSAIHAEPIFDVDKSHSEEEIEA